MAGPSWLADVLAAAMLLAAGYAVSRLAASRVLRVATEADTDGLHALMGTAMAGMFLPQLRLLPNSVWAMAFAAAAAWFAGSAIRARRGAARPWQCPFPIPHLVECLAMLYMLLVVPVGQRRSGMAMPGMGSSGVSAGSPGLVLVLALFMLGYLLWTTDRLATRARATRVPTTASPAQHRVLVPVPSAAPSHLTSLASPIDTARAAEAPHLHPAAQHPLLTAQWADMSKIVMSITMGYMLVSML